MVKLFATNIAIMRAFTKMREALLLDEMIKIGFVHDG